MCRRPLEPEYVESLQDLLTSHLVNKKKKQQQQHVFALDPFITWQFKALGFKCTRDQICSLLLLIYKREAGRGAKKQVDLIPMSALNLGDICDSVRMLNLDFRQTRTGASSGLVFELSDYLEDNADYDGEDFGEGDRHVILIIDRRLQMLPFESCPNLKGLSVSRVPAISILRDQLIRRSCQQNPSASDDNEAMMISGVQGKDVFYVLNPSGDLVNTQSEFEGYLKRQAQ
jgi:hypothetical protein